MRRINVPIKLSHFKDGGLHPVVKINITNEEHWAVLDTGASRSVFDNRIFEMPSEKKRKGNMTTTTLLTSAHTSEFKIPKLKIGMLVIKDYKTITMNLDVLNKVYHSYGYPNICAILGSDIFYRYNAIIDYRKHQISFSKTLILESQLASSTTSNK